MRIVHVVDAAQAQAQVQQRISPPPTAWPERRVQAINRQPAPDDPAGVGSSPPDDGISLALSPEGRDAARQVALEELRASLEERHHAATGAADPGDEGRQQEAVRQLEQQDKDVRAHEYAHAAAAGALGSAPTFSYRVGPDGRLYAVAGEVKIDTSPVPGDPEATLRKAQQIEQAAFAPGDPSPEDRRAAVMAAALASKARQELARQQDDERRADSGRNAVRVDRRG